MFELHDRKKSLKSPATLSRRAFGIGATAIGLSFQSLPLLADSTVDLRLPGGGGERPTTETFPQKGKMISTHAPTAARNAIRGF